MAEKRYYWIKLMSDFFSQPKIKKLRRMTGGDTYVVIYIKLQLLSLKNEGVIIYEGIEETFAKELALTLDEVEEAVQTTLAYMAMQNLIVQISDNEFLLPETVELIGSEAASTIRSQKSRSKKKQLVLQCNADATNGNTDIDTDTYIYVDTHSHTDREKCVVLQNASMSDSTELQLAMDAFVTHRKDMGKPLTAEAIGLIVQRLNELAQNDMEKVEILNQSIRRGWKDVFPLTMDNGGKYDGGKKYRYGNTKFQNYKPGNYDFAEIERLEQALRLEQE